MKDENGGKAEGRLTVGEMHSGVLVGEDGFGAVARRRAATQSARVTSSWSST